MCLLRKPALFIQGEIPHNNNILIYKTITEDGVRVFLKPSTGQWTKIAFGSKHPYEMQVYSRVYGGPINK
jgi:hypothetical protein